MKLLMFGGAALLLACSHQSASTTSSGPKSEFVVSSGSSSTTVNVTHDGLAGPTYQVDVFPGGLRGTVGNQLADLKAQGNQITGTVGQRRVNLTVSPEGNETRIEGTYAGILSNMTVSPSSINGNAGGCSYTLNGENGHYFGTSVCRGVGAKQTRMQVPPNLVQQPDAERAAQLTVLLGR